MAIEKSTSIPGGAVPYESLFLAGRNLAVIVFGELLREGDGRCSIEAEYRDGLEQCDALARAVEGLRSAPPAVIRGFAAVFTEIVGGSASSGVSISPDYFERLTAHEMGFDGVEQ